MPIFDDAGPTTITLTLAHAPLPMSLALRFSLPTAAPAAPAAPATLPAWRRAAGVLVDAAVVLGGVVLAGLWVWRIASGWADDASARVAEVAMVPYGIIALFVVSLAAADRRVDAHTRSAWRRLAIALLCWCCAGVVWELSGRAPLSWADLFNIAFFPLVLWGVFRIPAAPSDRDARLRFCLDSGVVVLSGASAVWYFVLWPSLARGMVDPLTVLVNAAYPLGDLVLLFAACGLVFRRPDARSRRALGWVAVALFGRFAGDLMFGWEAASGTYRPGGLTDLTWLVFCWALPAGAAVQRRAVRRSDAGPGETLADRHGFNLLPYVSVAAVYGFLLTTARDAWGPRVLGVLLSAVGVTGLVLVRQFLATRENVRLQRERATQEATREVEARFRALVQHASDVTVVVDPHATVLFASPSVTRVLGYASAEVLGRTLLGLVHADDEARVRAAVAYAATQPGTTGPFTLRVQRADGEWRTVEALCANLLDEPEIGGVVVTARDVTERAALEAQLAHQAFHDPLTGLANRALFRDRVEQALARSARRGDGSVAVLFIDLDDFKTVNDSLGHGMGDRLLHAVSDRLRGATRGCDTVARLGGDEFAVLLEDAWAEGATSVAERVAESLAAPFTLTGTVEGTEIVATGSIGIAHARPEDGPDELLRNADVAMYRAKQRGKGGHEVFAPEMHAALLDRMELEADLRRALGDPACGEFRVLYQPIVELESGRVTGAESLVRWQHPRRGLVSPAAFIPAAEATGLIVPLGAWVLRQGCLEAARWQALRAARAAAAGAAAEPITITVNISGRQLQHPSLIATVASALEESRLEPASLVLEITESVIMQDTEANLATLHGLKELGVRLAIDDFGTGYSSLSYLQKFPVDILKIDKAFVDGVARGGSEAALARTIVALGDMLSLRCVAEGVEEDEQRRHLQALGCAYGQGYLFARPLTPEKAEERILADWSPVERAGGNGEAAGAAS